MVLALLGVLISIPKLKSYWPGFKKYTPLMASLVSRDIKVKYRRSALGLVWSILQPLLMMLIVTIVFSQVFRVKLGDYWIPGAVNESLVYALFYITGSFLFGFVTESTTLSLQSVLGNAALIKKVYIPKYIFPLQKCLFAFVNMLFSLIAVALVYLILQAPPPPTMPLVIVPMLCAAVFSLGLGLLLAAAEVYFRDVQHLYGIFTTAWMYLTPILYPLTILPDWVQPFMQLNPLVHFVNYTRDVMMNNVVPGLEANLICGGFAVATLLIGVFVFKKSQDNFILHI
jgi:ABC-2 type transport system permease protein